MNMGQLIDRLFELRAKKKDHADSMRVLQKEIDQLNGDLMTRMDGESTIKACGTLASATLRAEEFPNIEDWDAVYRYMIENDACYILEKRMSAAAYRELMAMGTAIPGTTSFEKRTISLRKT